ncbi:UNVERIFIED_ORG: O-antigen/teichoic acid export membrane protein [Buttiauxella agrestis ATCC 33320]
MSFYRKTSMYLFANILNAAIPFFLLPILTRYLTVSEYGQVAIFQTVITGLVSLIAFNTLGAMARIYYDDKDTLYKQNYNGACFVLLVTSLIIILPLAYLFSNEIVGFLGIPFYWVICAILIGGINFVVQFRLNQWQIRGDAIRFGLLQIGQSSALFFSSIMFVVILVKGAQGRIESHLYSMMLIFIITIVLIFRDKLIRINNLKKDMFIDALKFSIPLIPHVFGIYLLSSVDRFFINTKLGPGQAGIYMVAVQLSLGMVVFFDALNKAFMPWLFEKLSTQAYKYRRHIAIKTYIYFSILIVSGGVAFYISPWAVVLIAGEKYMEAGRVVSWLCIGQVFLGMYLMVTNYLFYAKKTGQLSILTVSCGVINILLLLYLMSGLGIQGVAIAFAISMFLRFIGTWYLAYKTKLIPWF